MIRVLHFSDVHVQEPVSTVPLVELMGKRLLAVGNLWLSRGKFFRDVPAKLRALAAFAREQHVDLGLCTGDYTAIGTDAELAQARLAMTPFTELPLGLVTVPGNHDLYLPDTLRDARFEKHFGAVQKSDLPEYASDGAYPFVRLCGEQLAVVGVNSSKPNPNPFSSAGRIPDAQLAALARVLDDARVRDRWVIVMTHYGILRKNGVPDSAHHGLENADELMRICARPRMLVVHGHIHWRYSHAATKERPWLFCSGSATHAGREGAWIYEVDANTLRALPVRWQDGAYRVEAENVVQVS